MNLENLETILASEPKYRIKQIDQAIFVNLIDDWSKISNLPLALREKLAVGCDLKISGQNFIAKDENTQKALITLSDGLKIETVLLGHRDGRSTICVSSQVGCPLGCLFCATGQMGFKRNLKAWEIIEQVLFFARLLKKENKKITNVVFMGMGEPFLNYDEVLKAIRMINNPAYFNIGSRKISISTCGIIEGIKKLAGENLQVNLAISLHAPNDKLRSQLMPINKNYPLKELLPVIDDYVKKTSRQVMFEYLMIKDVNDSLAQAKELAALLKNKLYLVNLITYNPTGKFKPTSGSVIQAFKKELEKNGVKVTQRYNFGQDIAAACGQLATKLEDD
ncbi:MAG: 23S rRNA (adenine(2503)-C(2))-methyltransferase RlmN [Patescibacteria group bacterium]|jgi:23S rRNA (adenine2503-C2)-methyltransferase